MKLTRFKELQTLSILRQAEGGVPVAELCREHGMSNASFYKWRAKYGGMDASMNARTMTLEDRSRKRNWSSESIARRSNRRLQKMFAELSMQNELLKVALGKK